MRSADGMRLMVLGHSHTNCLVESLSAGVSGVAGWRALHFRHWRARLKRREGLLEPSEIVSRADAEISRQIGKLGGHAGRLPSRHVPGFVLKNDITTVVCLRGAQHIFRALVASETPYDFVLPAEPDLPLEKGAQVLPYGAVRAYYEKVLAGTLDQLRQIHRLIRHNIVHIETPPPYKDDAYILARLSEKFVELYPEGFEIAPAYFRYKIWRICSDIYREECEALSIRYVSVPDRAMSEHFLSPNAYHPDAVHANEWYGREYLMKIVSGTSTPAEETVDG